jgi:hypothetical protein
MWRLSTGSVTLKRVNSRNKAALAPIAAMTIDSLDTIDRNPGTQ